MSLCLPPVEPLILDLSPLESVVCQLQFHEILRIKTEPPTKFQEEIRQQYPKLEQEQDVKIGIAGSHRVVASDTLSWQFKDSQEDWAVSLTSNFISISTEKYKNFEEFLANLKPVLNAFEQEYQPPYYTRVGLRYINRIFQQRQSDKSVDWGKYLNKRIAEEYTDPVIGEAISEAKHLILLRSEQGFIAWRYSHDIGRTDDGPAERFTLDFDHYINGKINVGEVIGLLREFNDAVYHLFRWCLTDHGLQSFKPRLKHTGKSDEKTELT